MGHWVCNCGGRSYVLRFLELSLWESQALKPSDSDRTTRISPALHWHQALEPERSHGVPTLNSLYIDYFVMIQRCARDLLLLLSLKHIYKWASNGGKDTERGRRVGRTRHLNGMISIHGRKERTLSVEASETCPQSLLTSTSASTRHGALSRGRCFTLNFYQSTQDIYLFTIHPSDYVRPWPH